MTTKHTPGPWRINPGTVEIRGADWNDIVADAGSDADAALIAAAPDLLEALEAAHGYLVMFGTDHGDHIRGVCRAAIAKAKGKA